MSRLTKKHYEAIARTLAETHASAETIAAISYALAPTNVKFDRARFCARASWSETTRYQLVQMGIAL